MFYIAHFGGNEYVVEDLDEGRKIIRGVVIERYWPWFLPVGSILTRDHNLITYSCESDTYDGAVLSRVADDL